MAETTFQESVATERTRLRAEQKAIAAQQKELEKKLADITRELSAIDAYETAKAGKAAKPAAAAPRKTRAASKAPTTRGRRGSKREPILKLIADNPTGLTRGEILTKLGVKGDKSGEMSVSNALTALAKGNQVRRDGGKYLAAS